MKALHLSEISIDHPEYIRFRLPPSETQGYDVEITIDYGYSDDTRKKLTANAWARVGDSSIKGFISPVTVPYDKKQPDLKAYDDAIISALNRSQTFLDMLDGYIEMCARHEST